jgi:hypothetical protein
MKDHHRQDGNGTQAIDVWPIGCMKVFFHQAPENTDQEGSFVGTSDPMGRAAGFHPEGSRDH